MDAVSYKTVSVNAKSANKTWVLVDASDMVADCGDYVIIVNAEKIRFTGNKMNDKEYVHYTGYPGGQRFATPTEWMRKNPAMILENAIRGMLPKNRLGREIYRNLHIYVGSEHPHTAQQPKTLKLS